MAILGGSCSGDTHQWTGPRGKILSPSQSPGLIMSIIMSGRADFSLDNFF